jgi:hypothetical protein
MESRVGQTIGWNPFLIPRWNRPESFNLSKSTKTSGPNIINGDSDEDLIVCWIWSSSEPPAVRIYKDAISLVI